MITKKEYLSAKLVVKTYESQYHPLITWKCARTLYMRNSKIIAFTKGEDYKQVFANCLIAIDDTGVEHGLGDWEKYFIEIKQGK